jgi:hypothetical protein
MREVAHALRAAQLHHTNRVASVREVASGWPCSLDLPGNVGLSHSDGGPDHQLSDWTYVGECDVMPIVDQQVGEAGSHLMGLRVGAQCIAVRSTRPPSKLSPSWEGILGSVTRNTRPPSKLLDSQSGFQRRQHTSQWLLGYLGC